MGADVERLIEAKEWALKNPLHFDMGTWLKVSADPEGNPCGTTMCLAGYGAQRADEEMMKGLEGRLVLALKHEEGGIPDILPMSNGGRAYCGDDIAEAGAAWFRLTKAQADWLFESYAQHWLGNIELLINNPDFEPGSEWGEEY